MNGVRQDIQIFFLPEITRSERSGSSSDVMVSPKHSKMAFHCEDSSAEVLMLINNTY